MHFWATWIKALCPSTDLRQGTNSQRYIALVAAVKKWISAQTWTWNVLNQPLRDHLTPFRARPIGVSASDIIPFSPNRNKISFNNTCTLRSPGEEFVNILLNSSTGSNNPFQPDGAHENNLTSSKSSSKSKSTSGFSGGGWIEVCKSADPLKLMAESVDPLKKST